MTFEATLVAAKLGNSKALSVLIKQFSPMFVHESFVKGRFDEDLEQEFIEILIKCVKTFDPSIYH